ncbi:Ribosomal RNA small subunit methyltransferase F [subsurface metagenome]
MNRLKILNKNEKKEIVNKLSKQFGVEEVPGLILRRGAERLFLFQGSFNEGQIKKLEDKVPVDKVGVYFAKIIKDEIKLSIEGTHLLKNQIQKNIFQLTKQQAEQWMKGQELNIQTGKKGFLVMKYKNDFLGCGKASEKKIGNFIPKSRRLREKMQ